MVEFKREDWLKENDRPNDKMQDFVRLHLCKEETILISCASCNFSGVQRLTDFSFGTGSCPACSHGEIDLNVDIYLPAIEKRFKGEADLLNKEELLAANEAVLARDKKAFEAEKKQIEIDKVQAVSEAEKVQKLEKALNQSLELNEDMKKIISDQENGLKELAKRPVYRDSFSIILLSKAGQIMEKLEFDSLAAAEEKAKIFRTSGLLAIVTVSPVPVESEQEEPDRQEEPEEQDGADLSE